MNTPAAQPAQGSGLITPVGSPLTSSYNQWISGRATGPDLPRPVLDFLAGAFGPLNPLNPMPIDEPGEDGRPEPRRWQYPVGWNLPVGQPGSEGLKLASFAMLRQFADRYSVVRAMLNIRKDEISGTEWDVGPTDYVASQIKGNKGAGAELKTRADIIVNFFKHVDPNYNSFQDWLNAALEELFVIDALSLYCHPTRVPGKGPFGTDLAALDALNGETIRPLVDIRGGRPRPPAPAFQQYLWGVPRTDLMDVITEADLDQMEDRLRESGVDLSADPAEEYRADQLLYLPYTRRVWTPYGMSPIEQALIPITIGLNRQAFLLDYFLEGTIPGVYVIAGDAYVTPTQQRQLQDTLNALAGDVAWKHRVIVLPPGSKTDPQKDLTWAKDIDQNIVEQVAMILHIQPHEIGMVPGGRTSGLGGKGMAEEQAHAVASQRTLPLLKWLKETLFDRVIQDLLGQKDLEWKWVGWEEQEDANEAAQREQILISTGQKSIDEARIDRGEDPWNLPLTKAPVLMSGASIIPLDPSVPPPPAPAPPGGGIPGAGNLPQAGQSALGAAMRQIGAPDPKKDPSAMLQSGKKKRQKKARKEIVGAVNDHLKDLAGAYRDNAKQMEDAQDRFKDAQDNKFGKADKLSVATLLKWKIQYNDKKLTKIVHDYLLRSYPDKVVEWAEDPDGKWEFEPHVDLKDIDMARRPGGRDPDKVAKIADTLGGGASMDPIVLIRLKDGTLMIADGWHRTLGAEKAGWKDVPAFIGEGFDQYEQLIEGPMQDESDSKKKVAHAELATLRRFIRKGGKVENFRTAAIDRDVMKFLAADIGRMDLGAAIDRAHGWVEKGGGNPQGLRDWYDNGADGQIDWGSDGDFMQCVNVASDHMDEEDARGFCNERHQDAVGGAPGTEKNISLGAPLSTGLVPYDLAGQGSSSGGVAPRCRVCERVLGADGSCPAGHIVKYDESEARDEAGRWAAGAAGASRARERDRYDTEINPKPRSIILTHYGRTQAGFGGQDVVRVRRKDTVEDVINDWEANHPSREVHAWRPWDDRTWPEAKKYDDAEPRDDHGRWTAGGSVDEAAHVGDSHSFDVPEGRVTVGPWRTGFGAETHTSNVRLGQYGRIGRIERLGTEAGDFNAISRTGNQRVFNSRDDSLDAADTALHAAANWVVSQWRTDAPYYPHGSPLPPGTSAMKYDDSEARDETGKWTDGGAVATDEGNLRASDVSDRANPGRAVLNALVKGQSPNIKPSEVRSLMEAALANPPAKPLDLDHVRVAGTRQFGQDGLHIRRADMPQIPFEKRDEWFAYLRDKGISVTEKQVNPQDLQPSQDEISVQRTAAMYSAIKAGDPEVTDGIMSSADNYVLDGHHRWAGYTAVSFEQPDVKMNTYEIGMDIKPLIETANEWNAATGVDHKQLVARPSVAKFLAAIEAELARRVG